MDSQTTRERCREHIAGPSVKRQKRRIKYRGPIHRIRPDNAKNTDPQRQSLFLDRLTYDVRVMVYAKILKSFHLSQLGDLTRAYRGYSRCNRIRSESCENNHAAHAWDGFIDHCPTLAMQSDNSFMDLFLTCRLIHFEATHVLYSCTPFILFDISGFQSLTTRTPTHYLNTITSLTLTWFVFPPLYLRSPTAKTLYGRRYNPTPTEQAWSNLCKQLAHMPRLTKLHITIHNLELTGLQLLKPLIDAFEIRDEGHDPSSWHTHTTPPDFEISFRHTDPLPWKTPLPFQIRLLDEEEEWRSAPGAKIWPPLAYGETAVWDRLGGKVCEAVGAGLGGVWRAGGRLWGR